jgi:hypothetical protein
MIMSFLGWGCDGLKWGWDAVRDRNKVGDRTHCVEVSYQWCKYRLMPDHYLGICYLLRHACCVAHFTLIINGELTALLVRFDFRRAFHREHLLQFPQL